MAAIDMYEGREWDCAVCGVSVPYHAGQGHPWRGADDDVQAPEAVADRHFD
jgi:hypothetical protein